MLEKLLIISTIALVILLVVSVLLFVGFIKSQYKLAKHNESWLFQKGRKK